MRKLSRMLIWYAFYSMLNIYRQFRNREWVCPMCIHTHLINNWWWKHNLKVIQRNFYMWTIIMLFQSWVDCLSIGVQAFIQNINFLIFSRLRMLASITMLHFLNALTCSLITLVSKCIQLHQILSLLSTINNKSCISVGEIIQIWS